MWETKMSVSNSVIIRKAYEDFAQGNIPSVFAAFDAGITWHVPGHSPLSGDYTGHDQIGGFFNARWSFPGARLALMCTTCWLKVISLLSWSLRMQNETGLPRRFRRFTSGE
jgi:hypothetical protein